MALITFICAMKFSLRHRSTGTIYVAFEPGLHWAFRLFFRKIYLNNPSGVPANKPVLIAANHPTAFIDPLLLCVFLDPPIYNMTRGDIFRKPFFRKLMEEVNMFPVYRVRDGYASRDRNDEVFEFCQNKLRDRHTVNIFVEGEHHLDRRIHPMQKGLARIAFGTYERYLLDDLQIIPAGCNYLHGDRTRDEVTLNIGQPIFVRDYWADYQLNAAAAINRLCQDIETALKSICFHIENPEDDILAEQLLTLHRSAHPAPALPILNYDTARFAPAKAVLDRLNTLPEAQKDELRNQANLYFKALDEAGLSDESLVRPEYGNVSWLVFLMAGGVPFLAGGVLSWPVRRLSRYLAGKLVKKKEFYTSILMGIGYLGGMIYILLLLTMGLVSRSAWLVAAALLVPLLTWFFLFYRDIWARWWAARRANNHPQRAELLELRGAISYASDVK